MNESLLEAVEVETGPSPRHAVVWLHGLGADGHDFEPLVPMLDVGGKAVRFVFPHAPVRPVSLNFGYRMRAWYDVHGLDRGSEQDEAGVRAAAQQIEALILREAERGVPARKLVLAGFSQGGALALYVGLRQAEALAGVLALSAYLPLADHLAAERHEASQHVPVFMAHGLADPVVVPALGEESRDRLLALGHAVEWRSYPMAHELCGQEIEDIGRWLRKVLV